MKHRFLLPAFLVVGLAMLTFPSGAASQAPAVADPRDAATDPSADFLARLDAMGREIEALPHRSGSGWKPYQRLRWFHEQRMTNGELPEVGARWRAWEQRRELERDASRRMSTTWFSLGPENAAGRMLALAFHPTDPDVLYGGAAGGGVWKTTDNGASWFPISDELPTLAVGGIAVSPTNPNVVVIGTGEATLNIDRIGGVGVFRSLDGGATWETTDLTYSVISGHGFHVVEAGPNGTFLAGATDGLWRSSDDGATWTQVRVDDDYYDVKWKPGDPSRVYTAKGNGSVGNNVKVSTDDGLTWTKAGTGQPPSALVGKTKLAVTVADPAVVYAWFGVRGTGGGMTGLYGTTDDGATWTARNTDPTLASGPFGGQSWYNLMLAADQANAANVVVGAVRLLRSTDSGVNFTEVMYNVDIGDSVHVDHHAAAWEPGSVTNLWIAGDGGVWKSTNGGLDWLDKNNGLVTYQFYDICVNNGPTSYYILGGTQDQGTDKWSGTTTWAKGMGRDGMVCNVSSVDGTTVYGEFQNGDHQKNLMSGDGDWTAGDWFRINGTPPDSITGNAAWVTPVDLDPNDTNHLYTSTADGTFRTTDGGSTWELVSSLQGVWYSVSPVDGDVVWMMAGLLARYSTDRGNTWNSAAPFGVAVPSATKILAHPTDVNTAFVTFSGYSAAANIVRTTDQGATWQNVTGNLFSQPVNAIAVDPSNPSDWYIGTDVGVFWSPNGGTNWIPFEDGFPNTVVVDLEIQNVQRKLVAGTHGRGAWEIDIPPPDPTSASPDVAASRHLMLDPPTPNPARDRTLLRWAARHEGRVALEVFDVAGRRVAALAEVSRGDGIVRTTPWLTDDVPSGVYFAVLTAGEAQKTRKLVVAR